MSFKSKKMQHGAINGNGIALLIGGVALGGMLVYSGVSGDELPLWPALAVIAVNLVAAGRLIWITVKARKRG